MGSSNGAGGGEGWDSGDRGAASIRVSGQIRLWVATVQVPQLRVTALGVSEMTASPSDVVGFHPEA